MAGPRSLLITGASGYIGGSVVTSLLQSSEEWVKQLEISVLVRKEEHVKIFEELGVTPIRFASFDSVDELEKIAEDFDIIFHGGAGWHVASAKALVAGLGRRREKTGKEVFYLQQSGTTNLCDRPRSAQYVETRTFSDRHDIFSYEKYFNSVEAYPQRTADIVVTETGRALGVPTCVLMSPIIFGTGTGPVSRHTVGLTWTVDAALKDGVATLVGDGSAAWSHVHVLDLADLVLVFLRHALEGTAIPTWEKGIYFTGTGYHTNYEVAQRVARVGFELGFLKTDELRTMTLEEAAAKWCHNNIALAEFIWLSNSRTKAEQAYEIGWKPHREDQWEGTTRVDLLDRHDDASTEKELPVY